MVDHIAVLPDIHGVLPALDAVLAEPDVSSADLIVLCGDLLAGPQPSATLQRLRDLGDRAWWVRGNADRELVQLAAGATTALPDPIVPWAARQLDEDQLALLAGLPTSLRAEVTGLGTVLFCHATPRDDEEMVLVDSSYARWREVLADVPAEVGTVVCGHTHMPFTRLVDRTLVVNPGSVGMPFGTTGAHWALLGGSAGPTVQLRRTPFDVAAACRSVEETSGYPEVSGWIDRYLRTPPSDAEIHPVFASF